MGSRLYDAGNWIRRVSPVAINRVYLVKAASRTLEARSLVYIVDLGAAACHVRHRIERLEQKSGKHKGKRAHASDA